MGLCDDAVYSNCCGIVNHSLAAGDKTGACTVLRFYGKHRVEAGGKEKVTGLLREAHRAEFTFL